MFKIDETVCMIMVIISGVGWCYYMPIGLFADIRGFIFAGLYMGLSLVWARLADKVSEFKEKQEK